MVRAYLFLLVMLAGPVLAQSSASPATANNKPEAQTSAANLPAAPVTGSPISELGTAYENSIKLLQNRFRIDYTVDEITLVFFREYGSIPVVLVRPDGSKIFQSQADGEELLWYDTATYDMVTIKHPMPGPWQAVGQVLQGSRVMVLSDLVLHADPLPNVIFSGEILKQTAYLTNGGQPIDYSEFRDVVDLSIDFISTNNPNYENFGAATETIARFEDNGKGLDEKPLDGTFTGQFNLAVAAGEWKPVFSVTTPMFSREQVDPNIVLYPNPISIKVDIDGGGPGYHKLLIDADRQHVDMKSLLIDGKIRYPNGDVQNFSLTELSNDIREFMIISYDYGIFRVKLTAYGNTVDGRDFILDVPEYSFLLEQPELENLAPALDENGNPILTPEGTPVMMDSASSDGTAGQQSTSEEKLAALDSAMADKALTESPVDNPTPITEEMSTGELVMWIVGLNGALVILGGGLIWFLMRTPKEKQPKSKDKGKGDNSAKVVSDDAGIIDLDMPKDN